jgi:hypothetical protein
MDGDMKAFAPRNNGINVSALSDGAIAESSLYSLTLKEQKSYNPIQTAVCFSNSTDKNERMSSSPFFAKLK